jgi:hypothetical protein
MPVHGPTVTKINNALEKANPIVETTGFLINLILWKIIEHKIKKTPALNQGFTLKFYKSMKTGKKQI